MAAAKVTIKPYKLKPSSGDSITRDDVATWKEVQLSHMRQNDDWKCFLPGGTYSTWRAADEGAAQAFAADAEVSAAFPDFLTCLATFSPAGFSETVKRESTSFNWVINLINDTFGLKTKGEHFLALDDIKFDFSGGFTYMQAYMQVKDFICSGLLAAGSRFEGKQYTNTEVLSPVAKNFITKEWLVKIDPRLLKHIHDTRGHLFTADKPTLACNMKTIADQIPTMLSELDGTAEISSSDSVSINYVPNRHGGAYPKPRGRGLLRGFGSRRGYAALVPRALPPPAPTQPPPSYGCQRCIEAIPARYDASRNHLTKDCPWPPNPTQNFQPKPNFRVVLVPENVEVPEESYYDQPVFDSQFYDEATLEDVTNVDDNKDSNYYSCISHLDSKNPIKIEALPICKVQTISATINGQNEIFTIDSGSEGNCIKYDTCKKLSLPVFPLDHDDRSVPTQADGKSVLDIVGQTKFTANRGNVTFYFTGFVARKLSTSILCGGPFIEQNKIVQELHNNRVVIDGKHIFLEDSPYSPDNLVVSNVNQEAKPVIHEETVKHWKIVLELLDANNIKLSPKKTACFPDKLDLLGWTKEGKFLIPDPHIQNVIAAAPLPENVKSLRSYLGAFRTFFRCKKEMSFLLKDLEEFQAGKKSCDKLVWTNELESKFFKSKEEILKLDKLYLPKQSDQLVMTSDWSEKGISCTLWAIVENSPKVVSRFSTKLEKSMENMLNDSQIKPKTLPCDGEMMAVYVGIKSPIISANIRASSKKTVCLVDNKPVVEAAKLLKDGKFSSSRVINNLMTALAEFNLEFQHHSAKMGQNKFDDFCSRNPASCNGNSSCKICSFIDDCQELTIGGLSFSLGKDCIIGNVCKSDNLVQEILRGEKSIPFNNRNALKYLQDRDPDLIKLKDYLTTAKRPTAKHTNINKVKRYLQKSNKLTIAKDGCIVVMKRDQFLNNRELIVIPEDISIGLIYAMHVNMNHPSAYQLSKILDTKFFILDKDSKVKEITKSCTLCCSISKIPREIETFKPNEMPQHPGNSFSVDILKINKKNIIVTVENFSGFVSTAFVKSEKSEDLLDGILMTTTPFRSSLTTTIRVDQAPGFRSLFKQKSSLSDLNISLELGNAKNKNALALADKKIKELGDEIRKLSSNGMVDLKILTKATSVVNEKVRHQGLTAREILFSRDQFSQNNLNLDDDVIAHDKMKKRKEGNIANAHSKAKVKLPSKVANAKRGQIVFLKHEISKHLKQEMYLVLDTDDSTETLVIVKLPHALSGNKSITFQPHNFSYIVRQTDIILSPNQPILSSFDVYDYDEFSSHDLALNTNEDTKVKPYYPYDDDENDEVAVAHDNYSVNSTSSHSSSAFFSDHDDNNDDDADDERTGEITQSD